jgi:chromosome segregation ATPase
MNQPHQDKPSRTEQLLRQWGADQAADGQPAAPMMPRHGRTVAGVLAKWAPLAAAACLLVAVGWLYVASRGAPAGRGAPSAAGVQLADLEAQALAMREQVSELSRRLGEQTAAAARADEQLRRAQQDQSELAGNLQKALARAAEATRATTLLSAQAEELKELSQKLGAALAERDGLQQQLTDANRKVESYRGTLAGETGSLRKLYDQAEAQRVQLAAELDAIKGRQTAMLEQFQRAYLAGVGSREPGVAARQAAVRRAKLLESLPALRRELKADSLRLLVDRCEALLLRLEMMDADQLSAESLAKMVETSGVLGQIDGVLAGYAGGPELRDWLLQARLILAGVDRA